MLKFRQRRLDPVNAAIQDLRHGLKIAGDVTGFVQQIDQMKADQAVHRIVQFHGQLSIQMFAKRRLFRNRFLEVGGHLIETAARTGAEIGIGGVRGQPIAAIGRTLIGIGVVVIDVAGIVLNFGILLGIEIDGFQGRGIVVAGVRAFGVAGLCAFGVAGLCAFTVTIGALVALQHRVFFELVFDEFA